MSAVEADGVFRAARVKLSQVARSNELVLESLSSTVARLRKQLEQIDKRTVLLGSILSDLHAGHDAYQLPDGSAQDQFAKLEHLVETKQFAQAYELALASGDDRVFYWLLSLRVTAIHVLPVRSQQAVLRWLARFLSTDRFVDLCLDELHAALQHGVPVGQDVHPRLRAALRQQSHSVLAAACLAALQQQRAVPVRHMSAT